jgi:hypothetical protein
MDISTTQQVLVIILSTVLAILLVLSIVIAVMVIKLVSSVKQVVAKAERAIESAEAVSDVIKKTAGQLGVLRIARTVFKLISKHSK